MTDESRPQSYLLSFETGGTVVELVGPRESVRALVRDVIEPGKEVRTVRDELEARGSDYGVETDVWLDL